MRALFALACALLFTAGTASGQTYRCSSGSTTYLSDRPCASNSSNKFGGYGGSRAGSGTSYFPPTPGAPKAQAHVKYLGAECGSINEAIRTGPSRGVRRDVIDALQQEYREKCSLEDQDARKQAQEDSAQVVQARLTERDNLKNQKRQAEVRSAQCLGMKDVIGLKRKRESQLNETEVQALRNLEQAYNQRCLSQ